MEKRIDINVLIVFFIGIIGLILTVGVVYGFLSADVTEDLSILTAVISSIVTGLLGIVVGKALN